MRLAAAIVAMLLRAMKLALAMCGAMTILSGAECGGPYLSVIRPCAAPYVIACVRFSTSSFDRISLTWRLIVRSLTANCSAIWRFDNPRAIQRSTSSSRGVKDSTD